MLNLCFPEWSYSMTYWANCCCHCLFTDVTLIKVLVGCDVADCKMLEENLRFTLRGCLGIRNKNIIVGIINDCLEVLLALPLHAALELINMASKKEGRRQLAQLRITRIFPIGQTFSIDIDLASPHSLADIEPDEALRIGKSEKRKKQWIIFFLLSLSIPTQAVINCSLVMEGTFASRSNLDGRFVSHWLWLSKVKTSWLVDKLYLEQRSVQLHLKPCLNRTSLVLLTQSLYLQLDPLIRVITVF